jgi:hypothetical protein
MQFACLHLEHPYGYGLCCCHCHVFMLAMCSCWLVFMLAMCSCWPCVHVGHVFMLAMCSCWLVFMLAMCSCWPCVLLVMLALRCVLRPVLHPVLCVCRSHQSTDAEIKALCKDLQVRLWSSAVVSSDILASHIRLAPSSGQHTIRMHLRYRLRKSGKQDLERNLL